MKGGCFNPSSNVFGGILLLVCILAFLGTIGSDPGSAFFWALLLVGYWLYRKHKEKKVEKDRKKAIVTARSRPNLFTFDSSITSRGVRDVKGRFSDLRPWAASIQNRYDNAQSSLKDAEIVVNDDIAQLADYRQNLRETTLQQYEVAISPFKHSLSLIAESIPVPKTLKEASEFVYPASLRPREIQREINTMSARTGNAISNQISAKGGISKMKQGDYVGIAISTAIAALFAVTAQSKQRTELEKLQAKVDEYCEYVRGAVSTYGAVVANIELLRKHHEISVRFMMERYNFVSALPRNIEIRSMGADKKAELEKFYIAGENLKQLMQVDPMKS